MPFIQSFILFLIHYYLPLQYIYHSTRVRGIPRSASARRREGDGFDARPTPRQS